VSAILIAAAVLLGVVLAAVTLVQQLYQESLRLRPHERPALEYFKEKLQARIGVDTDHGVLTFSLVKHTLLVLLGIVFLLLHPGPATLRSIVESCLLAWVTMLGATYIVPHVLYRRSSGRWLGAFAPLLRAVAFLMRPLVAVSAFFQSLTELTNGEPEEKETATPAENIEALITAGTEEGLIEESDRELIQSVVEFGDKVVREVMTPRPNIVAISADATLQQLRQLVITEQYSRVPVYEQNIDQVIGFVHVRDMFELQEVDREDRTVRELVRPILFVPETKPVSDLMRQMQQENTHMVMVVDEYGNTAGLATMEDLLEVIIGEIRDEHEPNSDIKEDGQGGYIVSGNFDLDRVGDLFESFHREEDIESTTVGGLVSEWLGRVPKAGDFVDRDGVRIEVLASDDLRVEQVRISRSQTVAQ
jgi:putative hemolysin